MMASFHDALSPFAGRGLGEARRSGGGVRRSHSQDPRFIVGGAAQPCRPSPIPLPTGRGEG